MAIRSEHGMSLVEVTIILIVASILAAAAAPTARRTIDAARLTRAAADESAIGTAINNFLSNTSNNGFSINGSNPAVGAATVVETLVSDGDIPRECNPAQGCTTAPLWTNAVDNAGGLTDFLERHLVTNNPRGSSANDYPAGAAAWRGAYISSPIDPDPWGNRYAVNVKWLATNSNCGSRTNDVFVLSAGPDEIIDTPYRVDVPNCNAGTAGTGGSVPKNDDLMAIVRRDVGVGVP
jgi:type II secretory pathway pseudopilin PulG